MKNLSNTYLIALSIIALVIGFSQFLVQKSISTGSTDSRTINISGRQRMLSQKITKASLAMQSALNEEEFSKRKGELQAAYNLWTTSHEALQFGSSELQMEEVNNSEKILSLFGEIEPHYQAIKGSVEGILTSETMEETKQEAFIGELQTVLANEGPFLKLMNDITFEYDSESTERVHSLSTTEYILFAIAVLLLIMEAAFIFRPAIKKIQEYTKELVVQGETLKKSLAKEEYLNNQARSIFSNVKQGVFLLDKNLMISEFYSKETETIFGTEHLENTSFLRLMRPRLVKRDLEALEMFVEHLFNPKIRETVVNRLNPVEQVEIFPEDSTVENLDPHFIRISFARIYHDGEIHRILVTVLDETANVRMRKQIEESEERNRVESTQLLAILKVEPQALSQFLSQSIESLSSISQEYEAYDNTDFKDLIAYTFNTVHKVKGNATLINLDIIESKLHKVEDSIAELKQLPSIEGKDFLKILYQLSETIAILNNMHEMQTKIASIYEQKSNEISLPPEPMGNGLLIATLERGLAKFSTEKGKNTRLKFEDNGVEIPEAYMNSIKDIITQLMRNSISHGIEAPEERIASGKSATATIRVWLQMTNKKMTVNYEDDGRGLNVKKILSKALENRLIEKDEISTLKSSDITNLIFRNDFSTSGEVDQYAGRGQGLGVVKSIVNKHSGSFKIGTKKGQNFKMQITLPGEAFKHLNKTA